VLSMAKPTQSYGHTTEVITPKFVNMPKEGKSYGSVVLPDDRRYVGRPEVLGMMQRGQAYSIDTEKQDWTNGTVIIVTKATLANGTVAASKGNGDQFKRQPTPEVDSRRMFVAGAVNSYIRTEHFMVHATKVGFGETLRQAVIAAKLIYDEEMVEKFAANA
jgi:hypothetical protein